MTEGNEPIQPVYSASGKLCNHSDWDWLNGTRTMIGLTKREQFAAMAMQAIIAPMFNGSTIDNLRYVCECSVIAADALIEQLNKQP